MGKMTGLELATLIRKTNNNIAIVFTTNMKEYVFRGYAVDAMQYLVKPISKTDCFKCLNKAYQSNKAKKYYLVNDLEKIFKIAHEDIIYIEKYLHSATIITMDQQYTFRKTVAKILEELNDELFMKCHKSYIINIRHIEAMTKNSVIMSNNKEIPLTKDSVSEVNNRFKRYNTNRV